MLLRKTGPAGPPPPRGERLSEGPLVECANSRARYRRGPRCRLLRAPVRAGGGRRPAGLPEKTTSPRNRNFSRRDLPAASRNPYPCLSKCPPRRAQARAASTSPTSSASSTPATPPSTPTPPPAAGRRPCAGPAPTARPPGPRRIGASPNPSRACGGAQAARPLWVRDAARGTHARNTGAKRTHTTHAHKHTRARAHTRTRTRASIPCVSLCGGKAALPSPEAGHGLVSVAGMGQCLWKKSKGCIILHSVTVQRSACPLCGSCFTRAAVLGLFRQWPEVICHTFCKTNQIPDTSGHRPGLPAMQ